MAYLMIENPGEAPLAGLLLFGATTKDSNSNAKTIGMFGSGTKHAVLVCLRRKLEVLVYSGTDRLTFSVRPQAVGNVIHDEVLVSVNGAKPQSTGATLAFGQHDWKDNVALAFREFVSNALDSVDGDEEAITVEVVASPRAKAGTTRVFVAWGDSPQSREVLKKYKEEWFLHFRPGFDPGVEGPIRKVVADTPAAFYRRGVLIRRSSKPIASLWDYNFVDLQLDEARNSDEYAMMGRAARLLAQDRRKMARTLKAMSQGTQLWESQLNGYDVGAELWRDTAGVDEVLGQEFSSDEVFVATPEEDRTARNMGKIPVMVPPNWATALNYCNSGKTFAKALTEDQREERTILPEVPERIRVAYEKWQDRILRASLAVMEGATPKAPRLYAFRSAAHKLEKLWGFCRFGDGIYINVDVDGVLLDLTVLEELAHWHSGQRDFERDFQNWVFRFAIEAWGKNER